MKGSREEGGDFAVCNDPQCDAHAREGLSNRCFTSQDIPMEEVTSSPPNGPENSGSDFSSRRLIIYKIRSSLDVLQRKWIVKSGAHVVSLFSFFLITTTTTTI